MWIGVLGSLWKGVIYELNLVFNLRVSLKWAMGVITWDWTPCWSEWEHVCNQMNPGIAILQERLTTFYSWTHKYAVMCNRKYNLGCHVFQPFNWIMTSQNRTPIGPEQIFCTKESYDSVYAVTDYVPQVRFASLPWSLAYRGESDIRFSSILVK